ncbi:MAG: hypothetical protein F4085_04930 [Acidimicrobiia bacterium]|nr:hypothetical protein [Acidimicrobiia bacterium]
MTTSPPAKTSPPACLTSATAERNRSTASWSMTGPRKMSRRRGSPTSTSAVFRVNKSTNSSNAGRSTYTLELAEHFCPESPKAALITPSAARSRSADAVTTAGFFPPISHTTGLGRLAATVRYRYIPTS